MESSTLALKSTKEVENSKEYFYRRILRCFEYWNLIGRGLEGANRY